MAGNNNRQNYFDQQIRQNGPDFILSLSPEKIQRNAKTRIFREMVTGQIDYTVYGKYFVDSKFFENLFIACYDELQNNTVIAQALQVYDMYYPGNQLTTILLGKHRSLSYVYTVIYNALYTMKMDNYNVGHLSGISAMLYDYRNIL
ncbi:MAG: hypothetical protein NC453_27200 [Muribaculum sp.]|nr:hypothetical protein [Muribaculum sp.]